MYYRINEGQSEGKLKLGLYATSSEAPHSFSITDGCFQLMFALGAPYGLNIQLLFFNFMYLLLSLSMLTFMSNLNAAIIKTWEKTCYLNQHLLPRGLLFDAVNPCSV